MCIEKNYLLILSLPNIRWVVSHNPLYLCLLALTHRKLRPQFHAQMPRSALAQSPSQLFLFFFSSYFFAHSFLPSIGFDLVLRNCDFIEICFNFLLEVGGLPSYTLKNKTIQIWAISSFGSYVENLEALSAWSGNGKLHENLNVLDSRHPGLAPGTMKGH